MKEYELIIFDLDGTLVQKWTDVLLPGVAEFLQRDDLPALAVATNQGGVGIRHWMKVGGFGNPGEYPTKGDILRKLRRFKSLDDALATVPVYVSWAYQSQKGTWSPTPPYAMTGEGSSTPLDCTWHSFGAISSWQQSWRKPAPGMLLAAMKQAKVQPEKTLMVGDSLADCAASTAARCNFMQASEFFGLG